MPQHLSLVIRASETMMEKTNQMNAAFRAKWVLQEKDSENHAFEESGEQFIENKLGVWFIEKKVEIGKNILILCCAFCTAPMPLQYILYVSRTPDNELFILGIPFKGLVSKVKIYIITLSTLNTFHFHIVYMSKVYVIQNKGVLKLKTEKNEMSDKITINSQNLQSSNMRFPLNNILWTRCTFLWRWVLIG